VICLRRGKVGAELKDDITEERILDAIA
jgi:hypothetical protein